MKKYELLVTGGTFDRFHKGHRDFLGYALSISQKVLVGLTTDSYALQKKTTNTLESYDTRERSVIQAFAQEYASQRIEIQPIDSVLIPSIWEDLPIEAILVTKNTEAGAKIINERRIQMQKQPLHIVFVPLTLGQDNVPISSTRIRSGIINRTGDSYVTDTMMQKTFLLPQTARESFTHPFGEVVPFEKIDFASIPMSRTITVGDVTTHTFLVSKRYPKIAIVDFLVEREKKYHSLQELGFLGTEKLFQIANPPGQLTSALFITLQEIFAQNNQQSILHITGEEDLSVLTILLYAPLTYHIFYGQPHVGMVHIEVTEKKKEEAKELIGKFSE